jgi:hypothetical protein
VALEPGRKLPAQLAEHPADQVVVVEQPLGRDPHRWFIARPRAEANPTARDGRVERIQLAPVEERSALAADVSMRLGKSAGFRHPGRS